MRSRATRFALPILSLLACAMSAARADAAETYVCEGGRTVTVEFGALETLKRTDACIAGYFGLSVEGGTVPAAVRGAPVATAPIATAPIATAPQAQPQQRKGRGAGAVMREIPTAPPPVGAQSALPAQTAPAQAAPTTPPGFASRQAAPGRAVVAPGADGRVSVPVRTLEFRRSGGQAPTAAPIAMPNTDYRNVRVLNASERSDQWFRHDM